MMHELFRMVSKKEMLITIALEYAIRKIQEHNEEPN
jgi:hypothetical protein